ncbi:endonuclease Q family protein [Paenibacillus sp.]|uniref:endonuclease Q family protein n=1 Tax=Paenibacillus sp. TaxID=58172 RepID=UPI002D2A608E|nr:endonuclease Q family protein [Paenibacillus sp.]HZG85159.1 endonuclease Q family protein [Paenibacillus sp.]
MNDTDTLRTYYADLHIHIGRTEAGAPVKITGSRDLTFFNIAHEASVRKGIHMTGIIDCQSPAVQEEIERYLDAGEMDELAGGGIRYRDTTVLLGSELEVKDPGFGPMHMLIFLPKLSAMKEFTAWLSGRMKNVSLSSQRVYALARELQEEAVGRGGIVIPAHIFTPHKSLYGSCCSRMEDVLDPADVAAVELGLSSDTAMADTIPELRRHAFVTNSDAHSLPKIAREYNALRLGEPTFEELVKALRGEGGRGIEANYGLTPQLGKYHKTYCESCDALIEAEAAAFAKTCPACGGTKLVRGVHDRIAFLGQAGERDVPVPERPPYRHQVPLEFVPGLGPRKREALLARFGTEMRILHDAPEAELADLAGPGPAAVIAAARIGGVEVASGGGGKYGKLK